ncbi:integrating conjugative element protein [Serratia ficaria]|uniref:integrating conjugative element protein n=1 Tax=Serratia ficaria TaxID=61651 RepID=UPI002177FB5C|nr:integrating conjugative element protein [Serratia ficaria]CAI1233288.1 integrating conjugative element protein, PFL_4695 family [Serratia ficaria]CAI1243469.1 integrating conjugative element protein, PFL_4695 family [Serratia ficaria]CAI2537540.1 integrating conjugative element protein, PFL_4695 family [Serratia ficaria]CAI2537542.1 integrating conjugative element protein, PFL_4695 family [Serratia ficaria]CAI2539406.1 integrating conjugative element protein, PFL_4695 family [Serratia ficar
MKPAFSWHATNPFVCTLLCIAVPAALAGQPPLVVVEDHGGTSALPYYQALDLPPRQDQTLPPTVSVPSPGSKVFSEADMLPVRSERLSPGVEARRVIQAPGLTPVFLVGDDNRSRAWLQERKAALQEIGAIGLVVNVGSAEALASLRKLVPELTLSPVSGDDLAQRLGLRHYPVLITASDIEQ